MDQRKKILVIEDEKDFGFLLKLNLEKTGKYEVSTAIDGEEGLKKAKEENPHLVILDLMLPKVPGEEICKEIRRDKNIGKVPIIMVTAKDSPADRIVGKVVGANSYISKPFRIEMLLEEIDRIINES